MALRRGARTGSVGVVVAAVLAACGGDGSTETVEEPSAADTVAEEEAAAEPVDLEATEDDDAGAEEQDDSADADPGDGPVDLASAQAELDPWGPFDDPPFDVELPGAPGEAILQLGDQRIEMVTGQCRGGPVYSIMGDPIEASRAAEGVFSFIGGASEGNDLDDLGVLFVLTEGTSGEGFDDEVMIRRAQRLEIIVPDMLPTQIRYLEFLDGSSLDGMETPNTTWAEAPSVRLTRDGLVTAEGTVLRSQSEFVDAPVEVAFAARCSEEWVASIDELEAEHR